MTRLAGVLSMGVVWALATPLPARAAAPGGRVDLHTHLTMRRAARPLFFGEPGTPPLARSTDAILLNQVDADGLRASGIRLVVAALWPPFRLRPGRTARDEAVQQLRALDDFVIDRPEFVVVRDAASLAKALPGDRIAVIPAVEGGEGITRVEDVDLLFAAGARVLSIVHFTENALAGAATLPNLQVLGVQPDRSRYGGLTPLGAAVVERMIQLGMVIDLTHSSEQAANAVLDRTERAGVPVLLSHAGARQVNESEPNVSDALVRRVARGGGLVGVIAQRTWAGRISEAARWDGFVEGTCDDVLAHWRYLAAVAGPSNVMLGSDFNGFTARPRAGGSCPDGLRNSADLETLYRALPEHGVPANALDGGVARLLEFWRRVEGAADSGERSRALQLQVPAADVFEAPTF